MEEERDRLYKIDSIEVLDYIKQSVEILMNMKGEEYDQFVKNREFQEKLKAKEERKRKEDLKRRPAETDRGRNYASRFVLSSSMLSGSSMQESVDTQN